MLELAGSREASFRHGELEGLDRKDRQTDGDRILPDSSGQQRGAQLVGVQSREASRPGGEELPPNTQGDHDPQGGAESLIRVGWALFCFSHLRLTYMVLLSQSQDA